DARVALGPPPEEASPAIAVRHARLASCLAVGQRDLQAATSIIADAKQRHHAQGDAGVTAAIASAAAFVHLAVGDLDSLDRDVASTGLGALALYAPPEHTLQSGVISSAPMEAEVSDVVAILRACQTAEDEPAVLRDVCTRVRGQLHAAAVGFLTWRDGRSELVVGDGVRLDSEI